MQTQFSVPASGAFASVALTAPVQPLHLVQTQQFVTEAARGNEALVSELQAAVASGEMRSVPLSDSSRNYLRRIFETSPVITAGDILSRQWEVYLAGFPSPLPHQVFAPTFADVIAGKIDRRTYASLIAQVEMRVFRKTSSVLQALRASFSERAEQWMNAELADARLAGTMDSMAYRATEKNDRSAYQSASPVYMTWAGFLAAKQDVSEIPVSLHEMNRCAWMLSSLLALHGESLSDRLNVTDAVNVFTKEQANILFMTALQFAFPLQQMKVLIRAAFRQSALFGFDAARNLPVFAAS